MYSSAVLLQVGCDVVLFVLVCPLANSLLRYDIGTVHDCRLISIIMQCSAIPLNE